MPSISTILAIYSFALHSATPTFLYDVQITFPSIFKVLFSIIISSSIVLCFLHADVFFRILHCLSLRQVTSNMILHRLHLNS